MATLIKNRRVVRDSWQPLEGGAQRWLSPREDGLLADFPEQGDVVVPLAVWTHRRAELIERHGRVGVSLDGHESPDAFVADLHRLELIAVNFAQFTDGRGYTLAHLLRTRHGYRGELRAVGDIFRDQLFYLSRVGFDAFALRDGEDAEGALAALEAFSEAYQAAFKQPQPLFRRRAA